MENEQLTSSVIMVKPQHFSFNPQTAKDNSFQNKVTIAEDKIRSLANSEFDNMVNNLRENDVEVLVFNPEYPDGVKVPDAVFPNNWFLTTPSGDIYIFPMKTENRKNERQTNQLINLFLENNYSCRQLSWVGGSPENKEILEGTGVMIIDHSNKEIFAGLSQRCDLKQLRNFADIAGYKINSVFNTKGINNNPIYHTNVLMCLGKTFAVVCLECIQKDQAILLTKELEDSGRSIIDISIDQMHSMCGNILQLRSKSNKPVIVMSESAFEGFTSLQIETLKLHGDLIINSIPTIESVGGGSCRCMVAENFLPKLL